MSYSALHTCQEITHYCTKSILSRHLSEYYYISIYLYISDSADPTFKFVGCFRDKSARDLQYAHVKESHSMSAAFCNKRCYGYRYMGLQVNDL